jgi:hypothetical protein
VVESLYLTLRAWSPISGGIPRYEFLDRLAIAPEDPVEVTDGPGSASVRLLAVERQDFDHVDTTVDAGARSEAFAKFVRDGLLNAAAWLGRQDSRIFADLRAAGRKTDVFVDGWIDQDQFDLDLPPEFLKACGALGLTVSILTND